MAWSPDEIVGQNVAREVARVVTIGHGGGLALRLMDTAPPFGTCVWGCGRRNFNKEHVVGRQIATLLGIPSPVEMHVGGWTGRNSQDLWMRI
jgi:hypothetical protein